MSSQTSWSLKHKIKKTVNEKGAEIFSRWYDTCILVVLELFVLK